MKTRVNVDYLRGMIETDGSIQVHISGKNIKPLVKISQKTNTNVLDEIEQHLNNEGITCFIAAGKAKSPNLVDKSKGRAPSLLVTGKHNVSKLLCLLRTTSDSFCFSSSKERDLLILDKIVNDSSLTLAQCLGLKKSLHKSSSNDPDLDKNGALPIEAWEKRFNLALGEARKSCDSILKQIDGSYTLHQLTIRKAIANNTLKVSDAYIAGLVDGDGGYGVTVSFREPYSKVKTRTIEWQGNLTFAMEASSRLTVEVLLHVIGSDTDILEVPSKTGSGVITSVKAHVRKQSEVGSLISIHARFPLIGDYKNAELATVIQLRELKAKKLMRNPQVVCDFLEEIYRVSSISSKGAPRPLTLSEAKAKAIEWLS